MLLLKELSCHPQFAHLLSHSTCILKQGTYPGRQHWCFKNLLVTPHATAHPNRVWLCQTLPLQYHGLILPCELGSVHRPILTIYSLHSWRLVHMKESPTTLKSILSATIPLFSSKRKLGEMCPSAEAIHKRCSRANNLVSKDSGAETAYSFQTKEEIGHRGILCQGKV